MRKISSKKYAQALYELTKDLSKEQIKIEVGNFLKLIAKNKDLKRIDQIFSAYDALAKREESIIDVRVTSAENLSPAQREDLKNHLKKEQNVKTVNLEEIVDKDLLGGFILKIGDTIFDASLKSRLASLRADLKK